jgi:hypothetical protein
MLKDGDVFWLASFRMKFLCRKSVDDADRR